MKLAVMQPCYLPWRGYFALMKLADAFIYLDDVALPQGRSLQTRVAIKTAQGRQWLSVPIIREPNQLIRDARISDDRWRRKHARTLRQELPRASELIIDLFEQPWTHLADLNIATADRLCHALKISPPVMRSSELRVSGDGWERILNLCRETGADHYITAHGARHYFDHEAFERAGIRVSYLDYDLTPYPQPHGAFDPYITVLDLIEHAPHCADLINARLVPWREFLAGVEPAAAHDQCATSSIRK